MDGINKTSNDDKYQTSQLLRFGRETHDFSIHLMTARQSHDLAEIIILIYALYMDGTWNVYGVT